MSTLISVGKEGTSDGTCVAGTVGAGFSEVMITGASVVEGFTGTWLVPGFGAVGTSEVEGTTVAGLVTGLTEVTSPDTSVAGCSVVVVETSYMHLMHSRTLTKSPRLQRQSILYSSFSISVFQGVGACLHWLFPTVCKSKNV